MSRLRLSRALCIWTFAVALSACGAFSKRAAVPELARPPSEPLAWIPADSTIIGRLEVGPWRQTPLWGVVQEAAKKGAWSPAHDTELIDDIALGGAPTPGPTAERASRDPVFVMALRGRFGAGYLEQRLEGTEVRSETLGPVTFHMRGEMSFAQISDGLVIVCSPAARQLVADRYSRGDAIVIRDGSLYGKLADRVAFEKATLALIAEDAADRGLGAFSARAAPPGLEHVAAQMGSLGLSVELGDQVTLRMASEARDGAAADALKKSTERALRSLQNNMFAALLGLRPLVNQLEVSQEQHVVLVRGAIAEAEVRALLSKVAGMMEIAMSQGAGLSGLPVLAP